MDKWREIMRYTLKNDFIEIEVKSLGAELTSMKKVSSSYEYLWQGDPAYWKRQAPVLFPIVGFLVDDTYTYKGKTYTMSKHGFARDSEFECVSSSDALVFKLTHSSDTLLMYPFEFEFYITYKLVESSVLVSYKVVNLNEFVMPFSVGAHPAFNLGSSGRFDFVETSASAYELLPAGISLTEPMDLSAGLDITPSLFDPDAVILADVSEATYTSGNVKIHMGFSGFPFLGLWQPFGGAPFVCIEPWFGMGDLADHNGDIMVKHGMELLDSKDTFEATYSITI